MFRLACIVLVAGLAGCAVWSGDDASKEPEREGPIKPIDAFEEVGKPQRDATPPGYSEEGLSQDIERLQNARRKYESERAREAAEQRRHQAECLEKGETRQVPIQDGSEEPVQYCAPPPPENGEDDGKDTQ